LLGGFILIASYHPSQQNTQTGRLTQPMFHSVFKRSRELLIRAVTERERLVE
jgi:uracil-DNA glycosylase